MEEYVNKIDLENLPKHVAIIMDGNRRWAKKNGKTTPQGHKEGAETLKRLAKFANKLGIKYMTVYAFSTENWKRAEDEVGTLMLLLQNYLERFSKKADAYNIKINILGDIEVLNDGLKKQIKEAIEKTKNNTGLVLNVAFNYGGRAEIIKATKEIVKRVQNGELNLEDINDAEFEKGLYTAGQPDPDLLIRTSGELRTSNYLPWQIVYSEFYFTDKFWPEFDNEELLKSIYEFQKSKNRNIYSCRIYE